MDSQSCGADVVAIVAADRVDEDTMRALRTISRKGCARIVLVIGAMDDSSLLEAVENGVCAVIKRADATPTRLVELAARAYSGEAALPPDLLGRLLKQVSRLQHQVLAPMGLNVAGLSDREIQVLKLVADGLDTRDIAAALHHSAPTVKHVLHDVTSRLQLRNRSHAVAYAIREGLI
jgi:DNA-binding NarL/FixJ family response regulator